MPNMFFSDSVTPAQWCVFSLGIDTTKSARRTVFGKYNFFNRDARVFSATRSTSTMFKSTNTRSSGPANSRNRIDSRIACVSRSIDGPSPISTSAAPSLKNASRAAAITAGCVSIILEGSIPTRFGFSNTVLPRTGKSNSSSVSSSTSPKSASYRSTRRIATREGGRENGGISAGAVRGIFSPLLPYPLETANRASRSSPAQPTRHPSPAPTFPRASTTHPTQFSIPHFCFRKHPARLWSAPSIQACQPYSDLSPASPGFFALPVSPPFFSTRAAPTQSAPSAALLLRRTPGDFRCSIRRQGTFCPRAFFLRIRFSLEILQEGLTTDCEPRRHLSRDRERSMQTQSVPPSSQSPESSSNRNNPDFEAPRLY